MANTEDRYDDFGFFYFLIAVLAIILIPSTYIYIKKWIKLFSSKYVGICNCDKCLAKSEELKKRERKPALWGLIKFFMFICLWICFIILIHHVSSNVSSHQQTITFDPYEILGIDTGASRDEIKKAFRKLSLQYHPDKSTDPEAPEKYIAIHKAYETLTDDATREKWEKYGNPDGPQGFSVGIALPSFLVDSKNSVFVLAIYVVFLVLIFPIIALYFWQRQKEVAGNQIMTKTMAIFFNGIQENYRFKKLIDIYSAAEEFRLAVRVQSSDEEFLKKVKLQFPFTEPLPKPNKKNRVIHGYVFKNRILFYTHFSRLHKLLPPYLQNDLKLLLDKSQLIIAGMLQATYNRGLFTPTREVLLMNQMIVQAVWNPAVRHHQLDTSLLQLPHLNDVLLQKFERKKIGISKFVKASPEQRATLLEGLSAAQIQDIDNVCALLPTDLEVTFSVSSEETEDGEKEGFLGGTILTLTLVVDRPSKPSFLPINEKPKPVNFGAPTSPFKQSEEDVPIEVHAPYLAQVKNEVWWLLLCIDTKLIALPKKITSLRHKSQFFLQFQSPPKTGNYEITVHLISDSYVGFDKQQPIKFRVTKDIAVNNTPLPQKPKEGEQNKEDDTESEEEEEEGTLSDSSSE